MEKNESKIEKEIYNRSFFYDLFLGRPQQAGEIANFVFWLFDNYKSGSRSKNSIDHSKLTGLDIGCGLGRMFKEFTKRGWRIYGYEPDEDYYHMALETANHLSDIAHANPVVEKKGFLELSVENVFDMVIAINGPFYYLLKVEDRIQALKNVFTALKPGGIMFLDLANFIFYLANYNQGDRKPHDIDKDTHVFTRSGEITVNWHEATWDHADTFLVDGKIQYEEVHRFAIITLPDLVYQLKTSGFINIQTFNSWSSRQNEEITGPRILIAAQKPYLSEDIQ